jgi:hypothetical protein
MINLAVFSPHILRLAGFLARLRDSLVGPGPGFPVLLWDHKLDEAYIAIPDYPELRLTPLRHGDEAPAARSGRRPIDLPSHPRAQLRLGIPARRHRLDTFDHLDLPGRGFVSGLHLTPSTKNLTEGEMLAVLPAEQVWLLTYNFLPSLHGNGVGGREGRAGRWV